VDEGVREGEAARYWRRLDDGRIECLVCPHHCRLKEGQRGACFVRACVNGVGVLTTYGRSSGFCVDPIEKKPLFHFLPGTAIFSFGTAGCNLRCRFCQNWNISKAREMDILAERATPREIAEAARKAGCSAVAFTYNDPVIFLEYAVDTARECHRLGLKTVAVTAGYIEGDARREFFEHMDAANIDLKAFTDRFYRELCGGDLQTVLETLLYVRRQTKVWLEVTTLLIPGENDSDEEIRALAGWVRKELGPETPLHFTAFYPSYMMMDHPPTRPETLRRARRMGLEAGLRYVYTGNIRDDEGESTYCHSCGAELIRRDGYRITGWKLDEAGRCRECGAVCAGVFAGSPGEWGGGRAAVHMGD